MSLNRHLYPISDGLLGMLDVAFWDIKGKAAGVPIAELLGVVSHRGARLPDRFALEPDPRRHLRRGGEP